MTRRIAILLFVCLATMASAQVQTFITHQFKDMSLADALALIKARQTEYRLTFVNNELEHIKVSANIKHLPVRRAIEELCKNQPVKVKTKGNDIYILYQKRKKTVDMGIFGYVYDNRTHNELVGATVQLLTRDSAVIATQEARSFWMSGDKKGYNAYFHFVIPKEQRQYILRVSHVGYETTHFPLAINNLHKREFLRQLPPLYLKQERNMLHEVTVTASKVMFYYRGDTLVYNADAFQLAEGSMLDALIRQLPGVELKDNGQIFHNGKFVQSLLLNGKEFFRGDSRVMLDNLPSYTVKEIKVYDKLTEKAEWLGSDMPNDKYYVMDVQLKKEYAIGILANIEAGGGIDERFLARLFALRFTDHSRLGAYANANNLNDNGTPGENNQWSPNTNSGRQTRQKAGFDYAIDDRDKLWKVEGNAQWEHTDNTLLTNTDRTNFLPTGNTYERMEASTRDHAVKIGTNHTLHLNRKMVRLAINPSLKYHHWDNRSQHEATAFTANDSLLYHNSQQGSGRGHELNGSLHANATIKLSENHTDNIEIAVATTHTDKDDDRLNRQLVRYGVASTYPNTYRDQSFKIHPDRSHEYKGTLTYNYTIKKGMSLETTYGFRRQEQRRENTLLAFENETDTMRQLPSVYDYQRTMDLANSYDSRLTEHAHDFSAILWWFPKVGKGTVSISLRAPFTYLRQRLQYRRGTLDTLITRRTLLFHLDWGYAQWTSDDRKYIVFLAPRLSATPPSLTHFVNIQDATDPLNIHEGNGDLRDAYHYSLRLVVRKTLREKQASQGFGIDYKYTQNALAMSCLYDGATGVRTYRPYNVNGNWQGNVNYYVSTPIDKARKLAITFAPQLSYAKSVDLMGTNGILERSKVGTSMYGQTVELTYKLANHHFRLASDNTWQHVGSKRDDFQDFNVADYKTTLAAQLKLPWQIEIDTDISLYMRRGYNDPALNTNEWVWNARLSRPFLKGSLLVMLDGFDLLMQRSHFSRSINAQGRTETWSNTMPRYLLLHAVWRWNKQPKKK